MFVVPAAGGGGNLLRAADGDDGHAGFIFEQKDEPAGSLRYLSSRFLQAEVEAFYTRLAAGGTEQRFTHRLDGDLQWHYNAWLTEQ